jgi:hypothetical protein
MRGPRQLTLTRTTILVAELAAIGEAFFVSQFLSMSPLASGWERMSEMLGVVRAACGRSITIPCDLCIHDGRVPLGSATVVFVTPSCCAAWYAAPERPYAPSLASRCSSVHRPLNDPHLEMHVDGRCLLRGVVGRGVYQVQSRHVFARTSLVAAPDADIASADAPMSASA